jgi:hypothetical protein
LERIFVAQKTLRSDFSGLKLLNFDLPKQEILVFDGFMCEVNFKFFYEVYTKKKYRPG